jgi:hypothetical protein
MGGKKMYRNPFRFILFFSKFSMEAGAPARAAGGDREEADALASPARKRFDLRFRARVAGAAGIALSVCLCVLAVAGLDDGRGQHGELEEVRSARTGRRICA